MRRILIHIPMQPHGEYDIFRPYDREALVSQVNKECGGRAPNYGNRLWFQGLISAISCPENHLEYFSADMTKEQINSDYDLVIAPMANIFWLWNTALLERLADRFTGIKIPVYVIACGIQADSFDDMDALVATMEKPAKRFISTIYQTGGEFAVRGYFTKEFFERLGFPSAVATGCPSMFQMGRGHCISDEKVSRDQFKPIINGTITDYPELFEKYEQSVFFDQHLFFRELFFPMEENRNTLKTLIHRYGLDATKLILQDRVQLIPHMNLWREYNRQNGFNFSFGSRIHGSIMPILSGVTTVLEYRDARTREMAEFFDIPHVLPEDRKGCRDLYELYMNVSYKDFNEKYVARFDAFEQFLIQCGIVDRINQENAFFKPVDSLPDITGTKQNRAELYELMKKNALYCNSYATALKIKRKLSR